MKTNRLFLFFFFSLFIAFFAHANEEDINDGNNHAYKVSGNFDDRAEISVKFLPGTGFVSWILTRNSETGALDDYGRFYVDDHWSGYLPENSRILIAMRGNGVNCYYFKVVKPTFGHIELIGASGSPSIEIAAGDALAIERLYNTHSAAWCPDP